MLKNTRCFAILAVLLCLNFNVVFAGENPVQPNTKYPDYAYQYLGNDRFEGFNRKMFTFNSKLNKFVIKPVHILYASIMPQYGMDRIKCACSNIEYPIRLTSCLIQRDFPASGRETLRFLTNTTLGLGGLYDPAKKLFHLEPVAEDMEQALAKCKIKSGPYLVVPVLASTTPRGLAGKALDAALNPSCYIATPVIALVKAGLTLNKSTAIQPLAKVLENNYADPYEVARKLYGLDNFIKNLNLDRKEVLDTEISIFDNNELVDMNSDNEIKVTVQQEEKVPAGEDKIALNDILKGGANIDDIILKSYDNKNSKLLADMILFDYNPQNPVVDAMRTALFDLPGINDSIWNELSLWNRCFSKKIKTSSVSIDPEREAYKFRYIMQKDKNSPVAIIYPSIGEGIMSYHSVVLAKLFFEEGYSVIIQGSHFHWEFVKSMPKEYKPGIPSQDADYLKSVTAKIINTLQTKYDCNFSRKVLIGTSFGALETLFLADKEAKNNTLGIDKFISINPPVELIYAMKQIDKNSEEWNKNTDDNFKNKIAVTAAKVMRIYKMKEQNPDAKIDALPFSEAEAKLITGFIMHQKLSDVVFAIEEKSKSQKCSDFYNAINNLNYQNYAEKYLLSDAYSTIEDLDYDASLHSIADYLKNNNNYKIYHAIDDYLVNHNQLKRLKQYSKDKTLLLSNGSHLGFLYRQEFIDDLRKEISLKNISIASRGY